MVFFMGRLTVDNKKWPAKSMTDHFFIIYGWLFSIGGLIVYFVSLEVVVELDFHSVAEFYIVTSSVVVNLLYACSGESLADVLCYGGGNDVLGNTGMSAFDVFPIAFAVKFNLVAVGEDYIVFLVQNHPVAL